MLFRKQPFSKWDDLDFILIQAYQFWEDESSNSNGLPTYMTQSGDDQVGFIVKSRPDAADAEIAAFDDEQSKKDESSKGLVRFAVPMMRDGSSVPEGGLAREEWYRKRAEFESIQDQQYAGLDDELRDLIGGLDTGEAFDPSEYGDGLQ